MQQDKKGLSKREKILLMLMLVAGFTAGMVMLAIVPLYNSWQDRQDEYGALVGERAQVAAMLTAEAGIRVGHSDAALEYSALRDGFLTEAHAAQIGRMMTRLFEDYGLTPIEQRLAQPAEFPYGDMFLIKTVTNTVSGTYADLTTFLDSVMEIDYLRVSQLNFSVPDDNEPTRISINFQVAMLRDVADE
jgi:hypothetical protein